jgi:hypothetical protein
MMKVSLLSILTVELLTLLLDSSRVYAQAPTSGLVAHYSFNQSLAELANGGSNALVFNDVSYVLDPTLGRYVLRVEGKGFTNPPAEWETSTGPGGYVRIPRPTLNGNQATFAISLLERGYSQWHGSSFLNVYDPATASQLQLIGHAWWMDPALKGTYFDFTKIAPTTENFSFDEFNGSGGGITINDPAWSSYQIVFNDGLVTIFKEGLLVAETSAQLPASGDIWIGIGWWNDGNSYATRLIADISDVHIYDRALDSTEITALAEATAVPEPSISALLLLSGAASLWALKRRKSKTASSHILSTDTSKL